MSQPAAGGILGSETVVVSAAELASMVAAAEASAAPPPPSPVQEMNDLHTIDVPLIDRGEEAAASVVESTPPPPPVEEVAPPPPPPPADVAPPPPPPPPEEFAPPPPPAPVGEVASALPPLPPTTDPSAAPPPPPSDLGTAPPPPPTTGAEPAPAPAAPAPAPSPNFPATGFVDPHGFRAHIERLGFQSKRSVGKPAAIASVLLVEGETAICLVKGRYLDRDAVCVLTESRLLFVNDNEWKPDLAELRLEAGLVVAGTADDRSASLLFTAPSGAQVMIDRISEGELAREMAQHVRSRVGG